MGSSIGFDRIIDVKLTTSQVPVDVGVSNAQLSGLSSTLKKLIKSVASDVQALLGTDSGETLSITCPDWGIKPAMSFEVNMVPGDVCYKARLTVTNMAFGRNVDVRKFTTMEVTVGYRDGDKRTFLCPIFTSYQSKPNPSGEYVFYGLTVGRTGARLIAETNHVIKFNGDTVVLDTLLSDMASQLGYTLEYKGIPESIQKAEIITQKKTIQATTALGLVTAVSTLIKDTVKTDDFDATLLLHDDKLCLVGTDVVYGDDKKEECIALNKVTSASYSGPALTVTAPYDPRMAPGGLFAMPVYIYSGDVLPNIMDLQAVGIADGKKIGLYRAITVQIKFSTTAENSMTILAVPARSMSPIKDSKYTSNIESAQAIVNKRLQESKTVRLEYGSVEQVPKEDNAATIYEGVTYTDPAGATFYNIQKGDELNKICRAAWKDGVLELTQTEIANAEKHLNGRRIGATKIEFAMFYPMVVASTLAAAKLDPTGKMNYGNFDENTKSNASNTDSLIEGYMLSIPNIDNTIIHGMFGNSMYAKLFQHAEEHYRGLGKTSEADMHAVIAAVLQYARG